MPVAKPKSTTQPLKVAANTTKPKADNGDWRKEILASLRALIMEADATITEEQKWKKPSNPAGVPLWSKGGMICTGEIYKDKVKLTFAYGAGLPDPKGLFNAGLDGGTRRAIDIPEGGSVDARAFKALVKAAVALNGAKVKKPFTKVKATTAAKPKPVKLLSGGNPQIAKADGDGPVQMFIAAMPDWKREVGLQLDAIITRTLPEVRKAVKWNTPMYGVEGLGWLLGFHCVTKYVKVAFFKGTSLRPLPPVESKQKEVRYLHIHEGDMIDEKLVTSWIKQASKLSGWMA